MSVTGEPEGEPMKVGVPVQDLYAGLHGVIGILAALRHASLTGEGQHVEAGLQIECFWEVCCLCLVCEVLLLSPTMSYSCWVCVFKASSKILDTVKDA